MSRISNTPSEMVPETTAVLNSPSSKLTAERKPAHIREQHNHNCQQFFGPVTGCVFAMPGANVYSSEGLREGGVDAKGTPSPKNASPSPKIKDRTPTLTKPTAKDIKAAKISAKTRELMTFRTHGVLDANITLLYQQMVKDGWIDARTTIDDFTSLFSGLRSEGKIIWSGKYGKGTLVFLFQYFEMESVITIDRGFTIPNILMGHFIDTKGHFLTRLDKGDAPNDKAGLEVQEYVKIMKYNPASKLRKDRTSDSIFDDESMGYDDGYDSYDHQDLHLHKR